VEEKLKAVFAKTFSLPVSSVSSDLSMENCSQWTSLEHFNLITTIEATFGVRFRSDRIPDLVSFAALQQELHRQLESRS